MSMKMSYSNFIKLVQGNYVPNICWIVVIEDHFTEEKNVIHLNHTDQTNCVYTISDRMHLYYMYDI